LAPAVWADAPYQQPTDPAHLIVGGRRVGPIKAFLKRADLEKQLGLKPTEIKDGTMDYFGNPRTITDLWPEDPARRLILLWTDEKQEKLYSVLIRGTSWQTQEGIGVGTTMRKIHALNGRPYHFASFMGSQPGIIIDLHGGRLVDSLKAMRFIFTPKVPAYETLTAAEKQALTEPGEFSSESPLGIKLNPRVETIELIFTAP
jgi:hypothetical protein